MDDIEQIKEDARQGRIDTNRLVDLLTTLQRQLHAAHQRIEELEKQIAGSPTAKVDEPFSLRAEEKRQQARVKKKKRKPNPKKRRGRLSNEEKIRLAQRSEDVFPQGIDPNQCQLSHIRPIWRLEQGHAVIIAYHVYRGPKNQYGKIPGVLGRGEFGLEILVEIAYLVHTIGLSFDKVGALLHFFQNLPLRKSQVDSLLYRLAKHWEDEFETLCTLVANSWVVHADETSWSLHSVWAFLSEKARVLLFGVHKDAETLKQVLDPESFAGIVISDDAAVYANFSQSQKCWAHLLRKAIKLTLQDPSEEKYRTFADRLLEIYRKACRVQRDGRLGDAGRARNVAKLDDEILELCGPMWVAELPPCEGLADDYRRLVHELMRLMLAKQLFVFVGAPPAEQPNGSLRVVEGTNNEAERTLRSAAQARKTGRTNKTLRGARRQTILSSVLESLRLYLSKFTLASVLEEIHRWAKVGQSCFAELLGKLNLAPSPRSVLDQVLPLPER